MSIIRGIIILAVTASSLHTQSAALFGPEDLGDLIDLEETEVDSLGLSKGALRKLV